MLSLGEGGAGFLRAAPRCRSWVLHQQTQPKSITCVPRVVFRERNPTAGRFPFISDVPTKACPLVRRMPVLAAGGEAKLLLFREGCKVYNGF